MQEILRAGPHTANVFHRGDGCRIVAPCSMASRRRSAILPLPRARRPGMAPRSRARVTPGQLDLFTQAGT